MALRGHEDKVSSLAFSPDGRRIVTGSRDHTLKVSSIERPIEVMSLYGGAECVALSPDGKRIVSGGRHDGRLELWDTKTGMKMSTLIGHEHPVVSVAFSTDGRQIVSGSWDRTLKIWDAETGAEAQTLSGHDDGRWVGRDRVGSGWLWTLMCPADTCSGIRFAKPSAGPTGRQPDRKVGGGQRWCFYVVRCGAGWLWRSWRAGGILRQGVWYWRRAGGHCELTKGLGERWWARAVAGQRVFCGTY